MALADKNCCQSDTEESSEDKHDCYGWFVHAEWEMWLTFTHYAKNYQVSLWANLLCALNPLWSSQPN